MEFNSPQNVMLGIITPSGPIFMGFSIEDFSKFVQTLNTILDNVGEKTPIPKVFEDAFKNKEE